jgi:hypothetical protein
MAGNVNLLMEDLSNLIKSLKMQDINQSSANNFMKRVIAHMETDVYSDMNRDSFKRSMDTVTFT